MIGILFYMMIDNGWFSIVGVKQNDRTEESRLK